MNEKLMEEKSYQKKGKWKKSKLKKSVFDEPFSAAGKKMEMNRTKR